MSEAIVTDRADRKAATQSPISAHPAFPAIVALWFAALFGMGSLVLPATFYERVFSATGISAMFTAAQAPLGVTARILIALAAAAAGVATGLFVARKVIAASAPKSTLSRRAAKLSPISAVDAPVAAKRPISAHEELFSGGLDAPMDAEPAREPVREQSGRRRTLAVNDESARSEFLDFAPVPGHAEIREADPVEHRQLAEPLADDAALDLAPFDETEAAKLDNFSVDPPAPVEAEMPAERQVFSPAPTRAPGEPSIADLVARFASAIESRRASTIAAQAEVPPVATRATETETDHPADAPEMESVAVQDPPAPIAPSPAFAAHAIPTALQPIGFDDDDADEGEEGDTLPDLDLTAALSRAPRPFAAPIVETAASTPEPAPMPGAFGGIEEPADERAADAFDEGYSSLLAMKSPFGLPREAVRIDDEDEGEGDEIEPVVVFPGQGPARRAAPAPEPAAFDAPVHAIARPFDAPQVRIDALARSNPAPARPDSGETERALRDALDKLQRMSGVG